MHYFHLYYPMPHPTLTILLAGGSADVRTVVSYGFFSYGSWLLWSFIWQCSRPVGKIRGLTVLVHVIAFEAHVKWIHYSYFSNRSDYNWFLSNFRFHFPSVYPFKFPSSRDIFMGHHTPHTAIWWLSACIGITGVGPGDPAADPAWRHTAPPVLIPAYICFTYANWRSEPSKLWIEFFWS